MVDLGTKRSITRKDLAEVCSALGLDARNVESIYVTHSVIQVRELSGGRIVTRAVAVKK